ncbi:MAG: Crp/Fnr family transcriptional regulator [Nevskiaceae bacterium]|nr:MAG: Crp/Fnr family transcriptional regulator [Nevskiaceae bacterium]TAM27783.1 MAG: Crp/Fnr family transcriptional regulator [Nevskiaceae bacterium]
MAFEIRSNAATTACNPAIRSACTLCPVGSHCVTAGLPQADMQRWAGVMIPHLPLAQAGKSLYAAGATADCVYVVRAGCIKTYTVDGEGNERVRGFFLPGDVVGLDAIGIGHYPENAVTVVGSQVCRVSKGQLQGLLVSAPALNQRVMERLTGELRLALALGGDYSADQRVASFLLHIQERLNGVGNTVKLPMSRRDIASYLRLATETVCRVLTRFEDKGWIVSADKTVTLREPSALWTLAEPVGICRPRLRLAA